MKGTRLTLPAKLGWTAVIAATLAALVMTAPAASAATTTTVDDFEDGDLSEYNENSAAAAQTQRVFSGSYALQLSPSGGDNVAGATSTSGLSAYPERGDVFETYVYINGSGERAKLFFGTQSNTAYDPDGYVVDITSSPDNQVALIVRQGGSATTLASQDVAWPSEQWLRVRVEWGANIIDVEVYNVSSGEKIADVSAEDRTYDTGGIGYGAGGGDAFWDNTTITGSATINSIELRNESAPSNLVTTQTTVKFFLENGSIISRTTSDGTVDVSDIDLTEAVAVRAEETSNYYGRTTHFNDLSTNNDFYLLPKTVSASEVRFKLDDNTGRFGSDETIIKLKKPITRSGTTKYRVIAADTPGANGFTVQLEPNTRYQIVIENLNTGEKRVLGRYNAPTSETVTLLISQAQLTLNETNRDYAYNATLRDEQNGADIVFKYTDSDDETGDIHVTIYEYGNKSNELLNSTYQGPFGNLTVTQPLTENQTEDTWVIHVETTVNGDPVSFKLVVGGRSGLILPVEFFALKVAAVTMVVVTPSMFPGERDALGAAIACLVALVAWWFDVLPPEVGAPAVAFGLLTAYLWKVRERRGAVQ